MTAFTLARELTQAGFVLTVEDGRLTVSPASRLTDEHRYLIRTHREGLIALLSIRARLWRVQTPTHDIDVIQGDPVTVTNILADFPDALTAAPIRLAARELAA